MSQWHSECHRGIARTEDGRRMRRTSFLGHLAAVLLLLGMIAACGTAGTSAQGHKLYRVPTSSGRSGDASMLAVKSGTLSAGMYRHKWCVWLAGPGSTRVPVVWPAGFHGQRHPLELLDAHGTF